MQFLARGVLRSRARTDDQVNRGQLVLMQSEGFADDPADPIALYTASDGTHSHRESDPWPAFIVRQSGHAEKSISKSLPPRVGSFKVRLATQAALRRECKPGGGRTVAGQALNPLVETARGAFDAAAEGAAFRAWLTG
jgi:hypothetical protein